MKINPNLSRKKSGHLYEITKNIRIPKQIGISLRSTFLFFLICIVAHLHPDISGHIFANNPYITSIAYNSGTARVSFQVSWDNSWYVAAAPANYDAVWCFVKYQTCGNPNSPWAHVNLSTTSSDHTFSCVSGCGSTVITVDAVSDGKGVFVRRNAVGTGSTGVWSVSAKISPALPAGTFNFKVFGIEMVYIPQASFQVGDGSGTTTNVFNSITIDNTYETGTIPAADLGGGAATVDLPAAYPAGYNAFYCMKHELTQDQYIGFLNTLLYDQQAARTTRAPDTLATYTAMYYSTPSAILNRNGLKISTSGFNNVLPAVYSCDLAGDNSYYASNDGFHVPANYTSWADLAAYLDWAALRPMSDLEFEKICRGPSARVADEYPWGTTGLTSAVSSALNNAGQITETSTASGNGLCAYNGTSTDGPIRAGFAATSITTRVTAGASYYGVLDMAGNVWERVVAVDATGSAYTGTLGDGAVTAAGNADAANWPGTNAVGTGYRGGSWNTQAADSKQLRTSDRTNAVTAETGRLNTLGGRGVR